MAEYSSIRVVALRVGRFGESLAEAHSLGVTPAAEDEPWRFAFQQSAARIYGKSLPSSYLTNLAANFRACLEAMAVVSAPQKVAAEWTIVSAYLLNTVDALQACNVRLEQAIPQKDVSLMEDRTPSVMPFATLASLCTVAGAEQLRAAGFSVASSLENLADAPLSTTETQMVNLLLDGARVVDVARLLGFSEREVYRQLKTLWRRLGVSGRTEGIGLCVREGWVTVS